MLLALVGAMAGMPTAWAQSEEGAAQGEAPLAALSNEAALASAQQDIRRYEQELGRLSGREQGILGELQQLRADLRLRESQYREVELRTAEVERRVAEGQARLETLEAQQAERRNYLATRLDQLYREGRDREVRRLLSAADAESRRSGRAYAGWLNRRDAAVLETYNREAQVVVDEQAKLEQIQAQLGDLRQELGTARTALRRSEAERSRALAAVRSDRRRRQDALAELRSAADELEQLIAGVDVSDVQLDMRKFRGLLDWPADGKVLSGFGTQIHPRFRTKVPHPGLDIEGRLGDDVRSVFDGTVRYAAWMRGYGLTLIVDHGGGLLSIYAHASILLAQQGQKVQRGQRIAKVGDSGSLEGAFLYFELRDGGKAVDPLRWLKPR